MPNITDNNGMTLAQILEEQRIREQISANVAAELRQTRMTRFRRQRDALLAAFQELEIARTHYGVRHVRRIMSRALDYFLSQFQTIRTGRNTGQGYFNQAHLHQAFARWCERRGVEYENATFVCDNCGDEYAEAFRLHAQDTRDDYCPHCAAGRYNVDYESRTFESYDPEPEYDDYEESSDDGRLLDHSASPMRQLGLPYLCDAAEESRMTDRTRLFGFEIEYVMENPDSLRNVIANRQRIGIHKADGSIPYGGGEFCTLPMTRAFASQAIEGQEGEFKLVLDSMVEMGARAWNRTCCGLHIHVTRASASWITWGKVERFMNSAANQALIDRCAGRLQNSYCQRERMPDPKSIPIRRARDKALRGSDRYQALNFATNKPTVEFRLFRGNVAYHGVMRAMEFCDSVIEWARTESTGSEMKAESYLAFLKSHAQAYPTLTRYLKLWDKDAGVTANADRTLAA